MGCGALAAVISIKSGALVGGRRGMISIPSSSSFPVGNSITRLITSCVCRNGQQMANARAPALIDARNLAPAKRRPDHYFLFLSLSLLSFSPCFPFFFFLLQKGYCIATYTYSADWPSQVAISGTEAVIFYPFVTLLTLFFFATCRCNSSADRRADGIPSVAIH